MFIKPFLCKISDLAEHSVNKIHKLSPSILKNDFYVNCLIELNGSEKLYEICRIESNQIVTFIKPLLH